MYIKGKNDPRDGSTPTCAWLAPSGLGIINSSNEKEDRESGRGQRKGRRGVWRKIMVIGVTKIHYIKALNLQRMSDRYLKGAEGVEGWLSG